MLQQTVYDLMCVPPHEPEDAKFTAADFDLYRLGYDVALMVTLRALTATVERFEMRERTKRLDAKRRRSPG